MEDLSCLFGVSDYFFSLLLLFSCVFVFLIFFFSSSPFFYLFPRLLLCPSLVGTHNEANIPEIRLNKFATVDTIKVDVGGGEKKQVSAKGCVIKGADLYLTVAEGDSGDQNCILKYEGCK